MVYATTLLGRINLRPLHELGNEFAVPRMNNKLFARLQSDLIDLAMTN